MSMVQQTADGMLVVRSATQTYVDTFANAALDFGVATPTLPAGVIDRIYEVGVRHPMSDGHTVKAAGPLPWPAGDSYIANIATALTNQATRNPSPQPHP